MSIILKQKESGVEIIEGHLPLGCPVKLYTEDEVEQLIASRLGQPLSEGISQAIPFQPQSKSHQDWMQEDEWEEPAGINEPENGLKMADFKP